MELLLEGEFDQPTPLGQPSLEVPEPLLTQGVVEELHNPVQRDDPLRRHQELPVLLTHGRPTPCSCHFV